MRNYFAAAILLSSALAAQAKPGQCLLEVANVPKLLGRCNVEIDKDGSFSIGTAERAQDLTYFATVRVEEDGSAVGYWNGAKGAGHAHDELGTLKQKGACWENDKARVCAWK